MENAIFALLLQVVLIASNAVFACAEIAVLSFNESRLAKLAADGDRRAKRLAALTEQPANFLATIQVAITLSGFLGSAFAADNFADPLVDWLIGLGVAIPRSTLNSIAVVVITLILSYFTLILGELVPKRVAMQKAEAVALGISGLVSFIARAFAPVVWLLTISTNAVLRLAGIDPNAKEEEVSEENIRLMVDEGGDKGIIDRREQAMIHNVFEFDDLAVGRIITHRTRLQVLWAADDAAAWDELLRAGSHTYYLVCGEDMDDVQGVLDVRAYFRGQTTDRNTVMRTAVQPAWFVPESVRADDLLQEMRSRSRTFAVVLDEYGGLRGVVTLYDLLLRLVNDLPQEDAGAVKA